MENLDSILKPLRKIILTGNSLDPDTRGFPLIHVNTFIPLERKLSCVSLKGPEKDAVKDEEKEEQQHCDVKNESRTVIEGTTIIAVVAVQLWEKSAKDLIKLIEDGQSEKVLDSLITASKLSSVSMEGVLLCLVILLKKSTEPNLTSKIYSSVPFICKTSPLFLLFIQLCKMYCVANDKKSSWGAGMKRAICSWYLHWDPLLLALELTRYPKAYSWSHRDILKLSHINFKKLPLGTSVVLSYIISGMESTRKRFKDEEAAKEIMDLLEVLTNRANETTNQEVIVERGKNISSRFGSLSIKDFPLQALNSVQVMTFLIENGKPPLIIEALKTTNLFKLLHSSTALRNQLVEKMNTDQFPKDIDMIHGIVAYNHCRRISTELLDSGDAKPKEWMKNPQPNPLKQNKVRAAVPRPKEIDDVLAALSQVITKGAQNIKKLEKDILICIDADRNMDNFISVLPEDPISKEVRGLQAVSFFLLAMSMVNKLDCIVPCLQKVKRKDYMVGPGAFHWLQSDIGRLSRSQSSRVNVEDALNSAVEKKVSVCIILCSKMNEILAKTVYEKFTKIKNGNEVANLRVILVGLDVSVEVIDISSFSHPDLLFLFGFNKTSLPVIHAFSKGFL